jgi:hypothetical protein
MGRTRAINAHVHAMKSCWKFLHRTQPIHPIEPPNSCFGKFRTVSLLHELQGKIGQTGNFNAHVQATKLCPNFLQERTRSTLLDPKLMF